MARRKKKAKSYRKPGWDKDGITKRSKPRVEIMPTVTHGSKGSKTKTKRATRRGDNQKIRQGIID